MSEPRKPATISEIAKACGVSIATVSRVFNGSASVAPATREKVEAAIRERGYAPNALARSLISSRTMTIGVVAADITNPYFSAIFTQIERLAMEAGYTVLLCNTFFVSTSYQQTPPVEAEIEYLDIMYRRQVDGVIIIGGQVDLHHVSDEYRAALRRLAETTPVVVMGRAIRDTDCLFIDHENGSGVVTALNYLASLGHRRIAFVGGEPGVTITDRRLAAYRATLPVIGAELDESLISTSDYYAKDGYHAGMALLSRTRDFTAALAINDSVALGLMRALKDEGLSVPEQVSLVSCEQFYSADYLIPRLTSIDQHAEVLGTMLIQALLSSIRGARDSANVQIRPELVIRESCRSIR